MTKSNASIEVTAGAGQTVATHDIDAKEHQVVVQADASGHILGSAPSYLYATPAAPVGIDKLYCDLFNAAGSGQVLEIQGIWAIPKTDVAVVGALGVRVDCYRTSAVGT